MVARGITRLVVRRAIRAATGSGGATPLLLDTYTGAAAAYSLRKLRTDYTGNCLRVRRSSDSAEQDIGFSGTDLDTAALLSFCGAGDGFVTTWYDQSGNGYDHSQPVAVDQPTIVSSGSLLTSQLSKPRISNNRGVKSGLERSGCFLSNGSVSMFTVVSWSNVATPALPTVFDAAQGSAFGSDGSLRFDFFSNLRLGTYNGSGTGDFITSAAPASDTPVLASAIIGASERRVYLDGSSVASDSKTGGVEFSRVSKTNLIGYEWSNSEVMGGWELIFYNSDQSDNRIAIESDMNSHWGVY